jgi:hypothetical protein
VATDLTVANTIFEQLGGVQFSAMTGVKKRNCVGSNDSLSCPLPHRHFFYVQLLPSDTYRVEYGKMTPNHERKVLVETTDVYCDELRGLFERVTGLRTSLSAVFA